MQALFWHPVQSALDPQEPGRLSWERPPSSQMHIISGDLDLGGVYDLDIPMIQQHTFKRKHSIYCSPRGNAWLQGRWYLGIFNKWYVSFRN